MTITAPVAGNDFTLDFNGQVTAAVPYNETAANVQTALNASPPSHPPGRWLSRWIRRGQFYTSALRGTLANTNVSQLVGAGTAAPSVFTFQDGTAGVSEVQTVTTAGNIAPLAGTFRLTFSGATTSPLVFGDSAATVQGALNGLSSIGGVGDSVSVAGGPVYTITFGGTLVNANVTQMTTAGSPQVATSAVTTLPGSKVLTTNHAVEPSASDRQRSGNRRLRIHAAAHSDRGAQRILRERLAALNGGYTSTYAFSVIYQAPLPGGNPLAGMIDTASINAADLIVTSPVGAFTGTTVFRRFSDLSRGTLSKIQANYHINADPNNLATWDDLDNGLYTVTMIASQVKTKAGAFVAAGDIGTFNVDVGHKFVVLNINDSGPDSLRQAVADAAALTPTALDLITFDTAGKFSTPQTIHFLPPLAITSDMYVTGPSSSNRVTLTQDDSADVVDVSDGSTSTITVKLTNMIVTGGNGVNGGGMTVGINDNLTLDTCSVTGNGTGIEGDGGIATTKTIVGGGIYVAANGLLTLTNSTISGNSTYTADLGGAYGAGGGVYFVNGGSLTATGAPFPAISPPATPAEAASTSSAPPPPCASSTAPSRATARSSAAVSSPATSPATSRCSTAPSPATPPTSVAVSPSGPASARPRLLARLFPATF